MKKNKFTLLIFAALLWGNTRPIIGQVITKYKIYCTDVYKNNESSNKIVEEHDEDVLYVNVYNNRVIISSEAFGIKIQFSGDCWHVKEKTKVRIEKGSEENGINDVFCSPNSQAIGYRRTRDLPVKPLLTIVIQDGYYYNFNITHGEIFDKKTRKWIMGKAETASNYIVDQVRRRLRKDLGELCPDFEYELDERIKLEDDDDPWNQ